MIWTRSFGKSRTFLALMIVLFVQEPEYSTSSVFGREPAGERKHTKDSVEAHVKEFPGIEYHNVSPYIYGQFIEHVGGCVTTVFGWERILR